MPHPSRFLQRVGYSRSETAFLSRPRHTGPSSKPLQPEASNEHEVFAIKHTTLSRRRFVTSTLVTAATFRLTQPSFARTLSSVPPCTLSSQQEVGPFYVANELLRSNIAENKPGIPLQLRIAILDSRTCTPIPNAAIDLWHCDALGLYSGYTETRLGPPPGGPEGRPPDFDPNHPHHHPGGPPPGPGGPPPMMGPTDKLTFLRGIQLTDTDGAVAFQTIFPGFYQGRVNHIHFKVRLAGHPDQRTYTAGHISHVGQVFFPEDLAAKLMITEPYASHHIHRTTQAEDNVFSHQHGDLSIAAVSPVHPENLSAGFHAHLTVAVDPTATPSPVGGPTDRNS